MATIKKQEGRGLNVIPSSLCDIPFPNVLLSGNCTQGGEDFQTIIDPNVNFIEAGVKTGDIVYFPEGSLVVTPVNEPCEVVNVIDEHTITVSGFLNLPSNYTIYAGPNNGGSSDGCLLFVGQGGTMEIKTVGGDVVTLDYVPDACFLPIQVRAVRTSMFGSPAAYFIAFW